MNWINITSDVFEDYNEYIYPNLQRVAASFTFEYMSCLFFMVIYCTFQSFKVTIAFVIQKALTHWFDCILSQSVSLVQLTKTKLQCNAPIFGRVIVWTQRCEMRWSYFVNDIWVLCNFEHPYDRACYATRRPYDAWSVLSLSITLHQWPQTVYFGSWYLSETIPYMTIDISEKNWLWYEKWYHLNTYQRRYINVTIGPSVLAVSNKNYDK